ncbi:MAG: C69 family dipeptidase [Candidatus Aminicenantes bacterium]|nr:C69 family dipeptidase [Candidatus Aminicenantes bacterium]
MRKFALAIVVVFCAAWLRAAEDSFGCYTIVVGREASADGSVLLAHNEDDSGRRLVNIHKVPARPLRRGEVFTLKSGATLPHAGPLPGLLWLQIPGADFADTYVSELGVAVTSDSCPSREDKGELSEGGIGFSLRRLAVERARTAREAVRIAGEMISRYGYSSSGRAYIFTDAREGWVLHAVKGKRWVARRVPDDEVAVIANRYIITGVDLTDGVNFQGSPDVVDYATRRGWYDADRDGEFDFAIAYSKPANYADAGNVLRQWRGLDLLASKPPKPDARLPFSFKPRRSVRLNDLFRVLRDHFEGTPYDTSDHYRKGSPNSGASRTICTESTQYAFVVQLRDGLPEDIAHVAWIARRRPDSNGFSPWYVSMATAPHGAGHEDAESAWRDHFAPLPAGVFEDPGLAFTTYAKLSEAVDRQYRQRIAKVQKIWRNHEEFLFKDLKDHEKEFVFLLQNNRALARHIIDNYIHGLEYRKRFLADELLREIR